MRLSKNIDAGGCVCANVLEDDMGVVYSRPMILIEYDQVEMYAYYGVNDIMPGLTGWVQINGRDASLEGEAS